MGSCYICQRKDGWNLHLTDWRDRQQTICRLCHASGCEKRHCMFTPDNPPCEVRFMDDSGEGFRDDSEVWCQNCADEAISYASE